MLAKSISGAAAAVQPAFIEDVFSTYLYTGNGSTQTITNGIDLSGKGGLVWIKGRSGATGHRLTDTVRGATKSLLTSGINAEATETTGLTAFGGTGFTIGDDADYNTSTATYVSWAFREQAKFFDVVTYTGDGIAGRTVSHNLGSVPGCILVKRLDTSGSWRVYHRSLGNTQALTLNTTDAAASSGAWNNTTPSATTFTLGNESTSNASGGTYVAYLFAHDAGGFGLAGTDNVISCGSYTGTGADNNAITLGYEPQWVLVKNTTAGSGDNWWMLDSMRGLPVLGTNSTALLANSSGAEFSPASLGANILSPTATGFNANGASSVTNGSGQTYIYIAIRRGPMRVPTSGTSVYSVSTRSTNQSAVQTITTNFPVDMLLCKSRDNWGFDYIFDRLRGLNPFIRTASTSAEDGSGSFFSIWNNTSAVTVASANWYSSKPVVDYSFRRAPGFFDVVCWTGTGGSPNISHNLGAVPQLLIQKIRGTSGGWYTQAYVNGINSYGQLQTTSSFTSLGSSNIPTSTTFVPIDNSSGFGFVAYLFASVAGVSKVGSYTGTGTTKQIDCGFTGGARFVLIKRTDSTGDWYVWDTARGIVAGNDPYLLLNSTAAEVTSTDYIDTYSAGFEISSTAPAAINANGGTFVFLAIA